MESSDADADDDAETVKRIEDTVRDVLEEMDMAGMVRAAAAQRLGTDLSVPRRRKIAQRVIDSFLRSLDQVQEGEQEKQDQVQEGEKEEDEDESQDDNDENEEDDDEEEEDDDEEEEEYEHDDAETTERIEETVWDVLKEADADSMTLAAVLATASRRLGLDLFVKRRKEFVQSVISSFLIWLDYNDEEEAAAAVPVQVQEEAKEEEKQDQVQEEEEMQVEKEEGGEKRGLEKRGCEFDGSDDDPIIHGVCCSFISIILYCYIYAFN